MPAKKTSKSELKNSVKPGGGQQSEEPSDSLLLAREHVMLASSLLKGQGVGELERLAWILEDSLQYLDQYELARQNTSGRIPEFPSISFDDFADEDLDRAVK